jgi:hypothetical protein
MDATVGIACWWRGDALARADTGAVGSLYGSGGREGAMVPIYGWLGCLRARRDIRQWQTRASPTNAKAVTLPTTTAATVVHGQALATGVGLTEGVGKLEGDTEEDGVGEA